MTNRTQWEKLEEGFVKVNWDASLDLERRRMRIRIMIRDEKGEAMVVVCDQKDYLDDAAVAESLALRKVVELCSVLNIRNARFEGDARTVIGAMSNDEEVFASYSSIVEDVDLISKIGQIGTYSLLVEKRIG